MTHKTKGIVLRAIKYGETSLVVSIFTELFGLQTYLINGVRTQKRAGNKAAMFQPSSILTMEVYHNDLKALQRIKECSWAHLYDHVLSDVVKNSISLYMVELLQKTLKQPEEQLDLFHFCEDAFLQLDVADNAVAANFAIYFTLNLPQFFGFRIHDNYSDKNNYLDLLEGNFTAEQPGHSSYFEGEMARISSDFLKIMQPSELRQVKLNKEIRRAFLAKLQDYYKIHVPEFGKMRSLDILHEVLG